MKRREFIGGIGVASVLGGAFDAFGGEKSLLRIGVMPHTHIGKTKGTFPTGYKACRETVEEVFGKMPPVARPKELFV